MGQRDVAGAARFGRKRHADQTRPHGVQRIRFRIHGDDAGGVGGLDPGLQLVERLHQVVLRGEHGRRLRRRAVAAVRGHAEAAFHRGRQGLEAEVAQEGQQGFRIRRLLAHLVDGPRCGHVIPERYQVAGNARHVGLFHQGLAALWLFDFFRAGQQGVEVTVFADQLRRRLHADAGHARHVVRRIAGQGLHVDHLVGCDTELFHHLLRADLTVLHGVEQDHAVIDQLHQVLVRGHDGDFRAPFAGLAGVGRDQVVGFEPVHVDGRHVERFGRLAHQFELRDQVVGCRWAVRLVFGVDVIAEGLARAVEDDGDEIGLRVLDQLHQHLGEPEHRVGRRAVGRRHRRQRVIGAEDEARAVDQKDMFALIGHGDPFR